MSEIQTVPQEEQQSRYETLSRARRPRQQPINRSSGASRRNRRRIGSSRKKTKQLKTLTRAQEKQYWKDIKRYENAPWLLAFTLALGKDIVDPIPIITIIVDILVTPYLFYFTWRYATKGERVFASAILVLEMFPFIGILPATAGMVFILHRRIEKKYRIARKRLGI